MKITAVETYWTRTPFDMGGKPATTGGLNWQTMNTVWLRIVTDQGLEGWGEAFGHASAATTMAVLNTQLAPAVLGQDARDIGGLRPRLSKAFHGFGRNGAHVFALSALDIALWDIAGKAAGLPLWRLFGATPVAQLTCYASLLRYGEASMVAAACERATARGYRDIKLHEITVPEVRAARQAIGPDARLMVDTNCPWTVWQAIDMARRMREFDLTWLEEPVSPPGDHAGLARVRREGGVPIAAGENAAGLHDFHAAVRGRRDRRRAAQRHQDRRAVGDAGDRRAGEGVRRARGAAQRLFRLRLPRLAARQRGDRAGCAVRAAVHRPGSEPAARSGGGEGRQGDGARRPRPRPRSGHGRAAPLSGRRAGDPSRMTALSTQRSRAPSDRPTACRWLNTMHCATGSPSLLCCCHAPATPRRCRSAAALLSPVPSACISSPFGPRVLPNRPLAGSYHYGIDMPAPAGEAVRATAPGKVMRIQRKGPGGLEVLVQHDGFVGIYSHLGMVTPSLAEGKTTLAAGEKLGVVGHTGLTYGMHLFFEMLLAGRPVDPAPYLGVPLCNGGVYRTRADMVASDGKIPPTRRDQDQ